MNTYVFDSSTQKKLFISFGIGVLLLILGIFFSGSSKTKEEHTSVAKTEVVAKASNHESTETHEAEAGHGHHAEASVSLLVKANIYSLFYFGFYIAIAALFFLSATNIAWGGWQVSFQKIPLAISTTVVFFLICLFTMFIFFKHDIFEWTHDYLYDPKDPRFDALLALKHGDFLSMNWFWSFNIVIAFSAVFLVYKWWKTLTEMDTNPSIKLFSSSRLFAAISIVVISFVINTFATWYWSMSIQPHWYSTMFTWNTMAGAAVTMLSIVIILIHFLKSKGYLPNVNVNHEHDVAKLMFAISVFWMYTFFSQYMLIWYANIPEETEFFRLRRNTDNYGFLFHFAIICNFVLPFFILMKRNSKRSRTTTLIAAFIIIFGQFAWFFLMNCPMLLPKNGFGIVSIGLLLMIGSIFGYLVLLMLSKIKDLESSTHPYVKESYKHHI
ncbi:MAG: hypothetical protein IPL21_12640 [Saprospirales bacterium]|jgi:hypothetical protein|nr:hypothetical protein [Saprospirales bacterium]